MRLIIFGNGRVGASMARYARHLMVDVGVVSHAEAADRPGVAARIAAADIVAAALPDDRLEAWLATWRPTIGDRRAIHFSGARQIDGMTGYHPLYSFPKEPLSPETMAGITIAREAGAPPFASVLPGAANPEFEVKSEDRAFYHALAVLSGNFAAHLWNEAAKAFGARFPVAPGDPMAYYVAGVVDRFRENPSDSATGPIARKDAATVAANLAALSHEPRLRALYLAFLASAWPDYPKAPAKDG